jgi:predicted nucleotidyltransferase
MTSDSDIIHDCTTMILKYLFDFIGRGNIVSVILTGSAARDQASYKYIDGKPFLESDLDLVVVVKRFAIIKSFILIKRLSKKLTLELKKKRLLSYVSFSIATEKVLLHASPSIFYQDLNLNGKVIFGTEKHSLLRKYETNDIPIQDVYRLIFNRMVESLEALVISGTIEKKITRDGFDLVLKRIAKLNFALIQAILIKEGFLIFNVFDLSKIMTENPYPLKKISQILNSLIKSYEDISRIRKIQKDYYIASIEECWLRVISQFNMILRILSGINGDDNAIPKLISKKEFLFEDELSSQKIKSFIAIFLQYFEIRKTVDFLRFIIFTIRFGSDYVYFPLYELFLSSVILLKYADEENLGDYQRLSDSSKAKLDRVYSKKKWLESFNQYLKIWIFKTGN